MRLLSGVVEDRSRPFVKDEVTILAASIKGKVVINISDAESYGSDRCLIGDSTDKDSDTDDEGVTQGVELSTALEPRSL